MFNPPLSPFHPLYVNVFSSFFPFCSPSSVLSFLSVVRKLTQQSKRVVTSRVQSVYFVSKVLPLALQSVKKLLYNSLRFCSNAFLSVVRLPIQLASANKFAGVYPIHGNCPVGSGSSFYFYANMKYIPRKRHHTVHHSVVSNKLSRVPSIAIHRCIFVAFLV